MGIGWIMPVWALFLSTQEDVIPGGGSVKPHRRTGVLFFLGFGRGDREGYNLSSIEVNIFIILHSLLACGRSSVSEDLKNMAGPPMMAGWCASSSSRATIPAVSVVRRALHGSGGVPSPTPSSSRFFPPRGGPLSCPATRPAPGYGATPPRFFPVPVPRFRRGFVSSPRREQQQEEVCGVASVPVDQIPPPTFRQKRIYAVQCAVPMIGRCILSIQLHVFTFTGTDHHVGSRLHDHDSDVLCVSMHGINAQHIRLRIYNNTSSFKVSASSTI